MALIIVNKWQVSNLVSGAVVFECCPGHNKLWTGNHFIIVITDLRCAMYKMQYTLLSSSSSITVNKSSPEVIWEECVTTPHSIECTRPLRVLAVQCPLQRSPITQPWVCYTVGHKKHTNILLCITSRNINRFSKFFHCLTQEEICYKSVITHPTTP